jgi:hypothetical protein
MARTISRALLIGRPRLDSTIGDTRRVAILRLVYLAAGTNDALHAQARYAVLSALAWGDGEQSIHLHTDAPEQYSLLAEMAPGQIAIHTIASVDPGKIFETKLSVIHDCARQFSGDAVLFCDADTFFVRLYQNLCARLFAGELMMHRCEYDIASHPTPQMRKFRRALRSAGLREESGWGAMWNSGVVGLPPGHAHIVDAARNTYARLTPHTKKKYLAEQYCLSQSISQSGQVASAEGWIFHYWYQKAAYTQAIQDRLNQWGGKSFAQILASIRADRLVLPAPAAKLHWWEKFLTRTGLRENPPEIRGLPK